MYAVLCAYTFIRLLIYLFLPTITHLFIFFFLRLSLLEEWRGIRDEPLSALSGVKGCIFVHASGWGTLVLEEMGHARVPLAWPEKLYNTETICQMERVTLILS